MGNTRRAGEEARDDAETNAPLPDIVRSRRSLLGAAGGGFILAASGLLLPAGLVEEAVAGDHAVRNAQHRKQHRRQKHRRVVTQPNFACRFFVAS